MKLALGPVSYYWPREQLLDFYETMAQAPLDIIYLGETVCSKRRPLRSEEWLELAGRLVDAGKEVVLSTLSLVEAESELKTLHHLCENPRFMVEANDMSAVQLLKGSEGFVAGPSINIYNENTLRVLADLGMTRWVMPVELSRDTLADLQRHRPAGVETELFAFGRLPLANSARCFTAHHHKLPKDDCQFRCLDDPGGIRLDTLEDEPFLTINGVQLQSAFSYSLLTELDDIEGLGVDILRLSPLPEHMDDVVRIFRACMDGMLDLHQGQAEVERMLNGELCDGYWHGKAGIELSRIQESITA